MLCNGRPSGKLNMPLIGLEAWLCKRRMSFASTTVFYPLPHLHICTFAFYHHLYRVTLYLDDGHTIFACCIIDYFDYLVIAKYAICYHLGVQCAFIACLLMSGCGHMMQTECLYTAFQLLLRKCLRFVEWCWMTGNYGPCSTQLQHGYWIFWIEVIFCLLLLTDILLKPYMKDQKQRNTKTKETLTADHTHLCIT